MSVRVFEPIAGYRIAAFTGPQGTRYCAWAPARPYEQIKPLLKVSYALGESIPEQRPNLGCWDTEQQARDACAAHHQEKAA